MSSIVPAEFPCSWVPSPEVMLHGINPAFGFLPWVIVLPSFINGLWPGSTSQIHHFLPKLLLVTAFYHSNRNLTMTRVYFGSQFDGTVSSSRWGKAWWFDCEADGHSDSTVRHLREMNAGTQLAFYFLFRLGPQPMEWCCTVRMAPPTSVNFSGNSLLDMSRSLSLRWFLILLSDL